MKYNKISIKKSLIVSFFAISFGTIFLLSLVFYIYTSNILLTRSNEMMSSSVSALSNQIDLEIKKMDTVSLNISYASLVKQNFDDIGKDSDKTKNLTEVFIAINGPLLNVQQINVYDFNGQTLSTGFVNQMTYTDLSEKDWFKKTLEADGKKYISPPSDEAKQNIGLMFKNKKYISMFRTYFTSFGDPIGIIEVIRDTNYIFESARKIMNEKDNATSIFIFDSNKNIILSELNETYPVNLDIDQFINYSQKEKDNSFQITDNDNEKYIANYIHSDYTDWSFVMITPEKVIYRPIYSLSFLIGGLSIAVLSLCFVVSYITALKFATPIKNLLEIIKNTSLHNIGDRDNTVYSDIKELYELHYAFKEMNKELSTSVSHAIESNKQETKARMLALQAQMNPHFLYNSLTNISVMAESGMNDGIVEMCHNISFMLRYISTNSDNLVTINDEIDYAKKYLDCMKIRYDSYLNYSIEMGSDSAQIKVPKLIIQPLVENAIKYGIGDYPLWNIEIKCFSVDNGFRISVSDNGTSFNKDKLNILLKHIDEIITNANYSSTSLSIDGMGLLNVYSRLRLLYGENTFFLIDTNNNSGTTVTVGGNV